MRDAVIISRDTPQWKGDLHLHTDRSPDSKTPYMEVFRELQEKGYNFCVVSDHEKYWDSTEADSDTFLALAGAETILKANPVREWQVDTRRKFIHVNLIKDTTRECCHPFRHDEQILRCYDQGLDCMNEFFRYLVEERGQIVQMNHPDWSHMEPEILLATQHCFGFEIYNTRSVIREGGQTDERAWDYCLSRGRRILATAGNDSHDYGPDYGECGRAATMVVTNDFSKYGIVKALKEGRFYPTTGPRILSLKIENGTLEVESTPAANITVSVFGYSADYHDNHGAAVWAPPGGTVESFSWKIREKTNYFRVKVTGLDGSAAWSQPIFTDDLIPHPPIEGRDFKAWSLPRYLDEIRSQAGDTL